MKSRFLCTFLLCLPLLKCFNAVDPGTKYRSPVIHTHEIMANAWTLASFPTYPFAVKDHIEGDSSTYSLFLSGSTKIGGVFLGRDDTIYPGKGYWILPKGEIMHFALDSMTEFEDDSLDIPIRPGWNYVGNPYPYAVHQKDVAFDFDWLRPMYGYLDSNYCESSLFKPWHGFLVLNQGSTEGSLTFYPVPWDSQSPAPDTQLSAGFNNEDDWIVQIVTECGGNIDSGALVGVKPNAADTLDSLDVRKAVAKPTKNTQTLFDYSRNASASVYYSSDIRRTPLTEKTLLLWEFVIIGKAQTTVQVSLAGVNDFPQSYLVYLGFKGEYQDMRQTQTYQTQLNVSEQYYSLVITTEQFLR